MGEKKSSLHSDGYGTGGVYSRYTGEDCLPSNGALCDGLDLIVSHRPGSWRSLYSVHDATACFTTDRCRQMIIKTAKCLWPW